MDSSPEKKEKAARGKPANPINQKRGKHAKKKGARGELEFANLLKEKGLTSRRTSQFCGKSGDASDIICEELAEYHIEVKRTETLSLYPAMDQAVHDAHGTKTPIVCHRRNHKEWLVVIRLDDFLKAVLTQST